MVNQKISATKDENHFISSSYPFMSGRPASVTETSIRKILFVLKRMITDNLIKKDQEWSALFHIFLKNESFFKKTNFVYLSDILSFLRDHVNERSNPMLQQFYINMLNRLLKLEIPGREVETGRFDEYMFSEYTRIASLPIESTYSKLDEIITTLLSIKSYDKCLEISSIIFDALQRSKTISRAEEEVVRDDIYNAMRTATDCMTELRRSNNIIVTSSIGLMVPANARLKFSERKYYENFITLYEILEDKGAMKQRHHGFAHLQQKFGEYSKLLKNQTN